MRLLIERQNRWTFELTSSYHMSNASCHPTYTPPNPFPTSAPFPGAHRVLSSTKVFTPELATPKADAGRVTKPSYSKSFRKQVGKVFNMRFRRHAPAPVSQSTRAPPMQDILPSHLQKYHVGPAELEGDYCHQTIFELEGTCEGGIEAGRLACMQSNIPIDRHHYGSDENSPYAHPQNVSSPVRSSQTESNAWNPSQSHFEVMQPHGQSFPMPYDVSPVTDQCWTDSFQRDCRYSGPQYGGPVDPSVSPSHRTAPSIHSPHDSSGWNSVHNSCESSPITVPSREDMTTESGHRQAFLNQSPGASLTTRTPFPSFDNSYSPHTSIPMRSVPRSEPGISPIRDSPESFKDINNVHEHRDNLDYPDPTHAACFPGDLPMVWNSNAPMHARLLNMSPASLVWDPVRSYMSSNGSLYNNQAPPGYDQQDSMASGIWNTRHFASKHSELKALQDKAVVEPEPQSPNELKQGGLSLHHEHSSPSLLCTFQGCLAKFTGQYRNGNLRRHKQQFHTGFPSNSSTLACNDCSNEYHRGDALKKHRWKEHRLGERPKKRRNRRNGKTSLLRQSESPSLLQEFMHGR